MTSRSVPYCNYVITLSAMRNFSNFDIFLGKYCFKESFFFFFFTSFRIFGKFFYRFSPVYVAAGSTSAGAGATGAAGDPSTATTCASDASSGSSGIGGTSPPPSSGLSSATPCVPIRMQLKSTANTGFFSVWASKPKHMWTFRPTKYTSLNFKHTRLRVQAGGKIGTQIGLGFLPENDAKVIYDQGSK